MSKADDLKEEKVLILSSQKWSKFEKILNKPQKPTQALRDLMSLEGFDN